MILVLALSFRYYISCKGSSNCDASFASDIKKVSETCVSVLIVLFKAFKGILVAVITGCKVTLASTISYSKAAFSTPALSYAFPNDRNHKKLLLTAASEGRWNEVSKLLEGGVTPSFRDSQLWTPLHYAATRNGSDTAISLLLQHKDTRSFWFADNKITPLHLAAQSGHTGMVKQITRAKGIGKHNWVEEKALSSAAVGKLRSTVKLRFHAQLKTFFETKEFTAREIAVIFDNFDTVFAFPNGKNDDIFQALSCASLLGDTHMVEMIWAHYKYRWNHNKHWTSPNDQVEGFPAPPLQLAIMSGDKATVAFFLEQGVPSSQQSKKSSNDYPAYSSPAHYAAMIGSKEMLLALERTGADLTTLDHRSRMPLSYAIEAIQLDAVEFLVRQKYKKRGWVLKYSINDRYLGAGHVWPNIKISDQAAGRERINGMLRDLNIRRF